MNFKELSKRYLDSVAFAQLETHSQKMYSHWVGRMPDSAMQSSKALFLFLQELPVRAATKNHCLSVIRAVYTWGLQEELITPSEDICRNVKRFRTTPPTVPGFTRAEIEAIGNVAEGPKEEMCALFLKVMFWTGARPGEVLGMKWGDIDYDNNLIAINGAKRREKGTVSRYCNLIPVIMDQLERVYAHEREHGHGDDKLIFQLPISVGSRPLEMRYVRDRLKIMCARLGIKKTLRQARTGLATAMLTSGYSLTDVQHTLGHKSIKTTQRYIRLTGQEKAKSFKGL